MVKGGACVAKGVHAWYARPPIYEIRPVNARAVGILLECILVQRTIFENFSFKRLILKLIWTRFELATNFSFVYFRVHWNQKFNRFCSNSRTSKC